MALAVANAGRLTPDIRLAQAISHFEASLLGEQKAEFRSLTIHTRRTPPTVNDVMKLTAEIDKHIGKKSRRCFGPRFTNILTTVQQFAALADIVVGGSQNMAACGVWCVVRMSLLVLKGLSTHMDRFSNLFMMIGRSSPRYQTLSLLYANSNRIRKYLAEYFIVIVDICHQFLEFSQKSIISQLASSLTDAKLQQAEALLKDWALQIKDEVDFLNTQSLIYDGQEISKIRSLVDTGYHCRIHQKNLARRLRWLDACTTHDHETAWKQARKRGNATIFRNNKNYMDWKSDSAHQSSTLVITGKLGAGKTVLTANIVDDLNLSRKETVCYFFCRQDTMYSCQSRTVIGSLCRQLLQCHVNDNTMDNLLSEHVSTVSYDDLVTLCKAVLLSKGKTYFVLDGLDECDDFERRQITQTLGVLQKNSVLHLLVSLRSRPDDIQTQYREFRPQLVFVCPEKNPDIESFINSELIAKIEAGELTLGRPSLVIEISQALNEGAQGMFLWVALQIESLCLERTDDSIRQALRVLPPDLPTTYVRILERSQPRSGRSYQKKILGHLLSALRPLRVGELREALDVMVGDTRWDPEKHVNNIYQTLACCGSLVVVAEEELTVHFIHQSVAQFLLQGAAISTDLHFDLTRASLELGEICITYLSYGVFDQRLSTGVVPKLAAGLTPAIVAHNTLQDAGILGQLALRLLRFQASGGPDISKVMAETDSIARKRRGSLEPFQFLAYASYHWMLHTTAIQNTSTTFHLWKHLLNDSKFDGLVWGPNEAHPDHLIVDEESGNIWKLPPRITWGVAHSHLALLQAEIHGRHGIRGLASIVPYINLTLRAGNKLIIEGAMCLKLFRIAVLFKANDAADAILHTGKQRMSREDFLEPYLDDKNLTNIMWVVSLQAFGSLEELQLPLVELACHHRDVEALAFAISRQADVNYCVWKHPIVIVLDRMHMNDNIDVMLATTLLKARCFLKACDSMCDEIYRYLHLYLLTSDSCDLEPFEVIMLSDRTTGLSIKSRADLVHRACVRGDLRMATSLLNGSMVSGSLPVISHPNLGSWLKGALHSTSAERTLLVQKLINLPLHMRAIGESVLIRCVQLRAWTLAREILLLIKNTWDQPKTFLKILRHFAHTVQVGQLVHLCAASGDYIGLEFLLADVPIDLDIRKNLSILTPADSELCGQRRLATADSELCGQTPLQLVWTQDFVSFQETVHFVQSAGTIIAYMDGHLGVHSSKTCGETPNSCLEHVPQFYIKVVGVLLRQGSLDFRFEADRGQNVQSDLEKLGLGFLEHLLEVWREHLFLVTDLRIEVLLLPVLHSIISGCATLARDSEAIFEDYCADADGDIIAEEYRKIRQMQWLWTRSRPLIELTTALMRVLGRKDLDSMIRSLIAKFPGLEHDLDGFEKCYV